MNALGDSVSAFEARHNEPLPDLRSAETILGAVDHGGQHNAARFRSTSILLADLTRCGPWERQRTTVRQRWLTDGRRMSYKRLGDRVRQTALPWFLAAANSIPGLLFTVLVDKRIPSVFEDSLKPRRPEFAGVAWSRPVFDRMLLTAHFLSFLLTGLSSPGQDVLLLLDEDAFVANEAMHRAFCEVFSTVSGHYLAHDLGRLKVATAKSDTGRRDLEDLLSIPDLAAGALSDTLSRDMRLEGLGEGIFLPPSRTAASKKTGQIMRWHADSTQALKRLVLTVFRDDSAGAGFRTAFLVFHGLRDGNHPMFSTYP